MSTPMWNTFMWIVIGLMLGYGLYLVRFFRIRSYFLKTLLIFLCIIFPIGAMIGFFSGKYSLENMGVTADEVLHE